MVAMGLTALLAVAVAIGAIFGLVRGLNKAVIRILTLILAAVLTFLIAGPVTLRIAEEAGLGEMILELLRSEPDVAAFLETAPLLQEVVRVLPAFVLSLVVFPVVFLLLKFLTWILFLIIQKPICKALFSKKETEEGRPASQLGSRLGGLGIGIVTGALIFAMILTPVFGMLSILPAASDMEEALNALVEQDYLSEADVSAILEAYEVADSPIVTVSHHIGLSNAGKTYINSVSSFEMDGRTIRLADELDTLLSLVQTAVKADTLTTLLESEDPNAIFVLLEDQAFVDSLMQELVQSQLLSAALPDLVATAMENVAADLNVPADKNAVYDNMMEDVSSAVQTADINYAGITAYEEAHSITYAFARSSAILRTGTDAELMTDEEYEAELQKLNALVVEISDILNHAISGDNQAFADSVAGHIVSQAKTQACENGQDYLSTFNVMSVVSTLLDSDLDEGQGELLEQLKDKEKFQTDVVTVEIIAQTIRTSVENALADEETASQTASTLATVVSNFAGALVAATDENGDLDATKLDFEKIAAAVTELQNSTLKDVGSSVLAIVANGDLGDSGMVSDMVNAVKEGYEKGEDIGGTITTAGALIGLGSAMGGEEADREAMVDSLTDLIQNLNDFTISLLPNILSSDTITSMGVPAEYADATYEVIETLLKELMKLKGAENYTSEVNTILSLYNLATSGVENFAQEDVADLVSYALRSDAIYNTLISVSKSNPFGIQIPDEAVRADLVQAIEDLYAESGRTERERSAYQAVAMLLGLEGDVNL